MLLLLLACSFAPAEPTPAEHAVSEPTVSEPAAPAAAPQALGELRVDQAPAPAKDIEAELRARITDHCEHLQSCGCAGEQRVEQCQSAASQTNLPAEVFRCTASVPCPLLCKVGPGGTSDKGTTQCVIPYLKSQIPGGPSQGPALKGRTSTRLPLDDRAKSILEEEKQKEPAQ